MNREFSRRLLLAVFPGPLMSSAVRLCEMYLIAVCILYGMIILVAPAAQFSGVVILDDWTKYGRFLCIPLFVKSVLGIAGLALDNWLLRFLGAFVGSVIWFWLTAKYINAGEITPTGFPFTFVAIYISIYIMISAFMMRQNRSG
jgi:hypothetical protein